MIVTCQSCTAGFKVDESKIGPRGARVRCPKCQTAMILQPPAAPAEAANPEPQAGASASEPVSETPEEVTHTGIKNPHEEITKTGITRAPQAPAELPREVDEHDAATRIAPIPSLPHLPRSFEEEAEQTRIAPPPMNMIPPMPKAPTPAPSAGPEMVPHPPAPSRPPPALFPDENDATEETGALDLDFDTSPVSSAPEPAVKRLDPLAELPRFDITPDEGAAAGMPREGTVTRPIALKDMQAQANAPHKPPVQLELQPGAPAPGTHTQSKAPTRVGLDTAALAERERVLSDARISKPLVWLTRAAIVLLFIAGLAGESVLFRTGGLQGLYGHTKRPIDGAILRRVALYPWLTRDGTRFVILRGDVQRFGAGTEPLKIEIAIDGQVVATPAPGMGIDDSALFLRGEVTPMPSDDMTFRYAWKDNRPIEALKAGLTVRIVP